MTEAPIDSPVRYRVGWGDLDANNHMANVAFLHHAADTRIAYFARRGFPGSRFGVERLGPVITKDELVYRKELRLGDEYTVDLYAVGLSPDGVHFSIRNTFRDASGELVAVVTSEGVWFDLDSRRPRAPPPELDAAQRSMPRSETFAEIPSRRS